MKIISFNVNSLRARLHQLQLVCEAHDPDIIALQETKVADNQFPTEELEYLGYDAVFHGQKTHYGVATLFKPSYLALNEIKGVPAGSPTDASHCRLLQVELEDRDGRSFHVLNGYFPQGESRQNQKKYHNKEGFYQTIKEVLEKNYSVDTPLLLAGDLNVAPEDQDIGFDDAERERWLAEGHCSFLPEERHWYQGLLDWGLIDSYRHLQPQNNEKFSWFDYRNRGFERTPKVGLRIDMILSTAALAEKCVDVGIDYELRSVDKASDHCPIWAEYQW